MKRFSSGFSGSPRSERFWTKLWFISLESELKLCDPQRCWDLLSCCQSGEPEMSLLLITWPRALLASIIETWDGPLRLYRGPSFHLLLLRVCGQLCGKLNGEKTSRCRRRHRSSACLSSVSLRSRLERFGLEDERCVKMLRRFELRLMARDGHELIISQLYLLSSRIYYARLV